MIDYVDLAERTVALYQYELDNRLVRTKAKSQEFLDQAKSNLKLVKKHTHDWNKLNEEAARLLADIYADETKELTQTEESQLTEKRRKFALLNKKKSYLEVEMAALSRPSRTTDTVVDKRDSFSVSAVKIALDIKIGMAIEEEGFLPDISEEHIDHLASWLAGCGYTKPSRSAKNI